MAEEDKKWIPAPINNGRWIPEGEGEKLVGNYIEKVEAPFRGRMNYKYYFQTDNPAANNEGVAFVYGTDAINEGMKDIPEGYQVKITYKGERPTNDPKKKPYKAFEVCAYLSEDDPLYKKWYPEDGPGKEEKKDAPTLAKGEDREAITTINHYREILEDQNKPITDKGIVRMASSDPDLELDDLTRIKVQVVEMVKSGQIQKEEEE